MLGGLIYLIWNYSQPVLLACAASYVASGIVIRIGGIVRRYLRPTRPAAAGASGWLGPQTLALVGSESLMGREIRDLLSSNSLGQDLKLIAAASEEAGKLTEQGGEPAFLVALEKENLESAGVIFLAGPPNRESKGA